MEMVSFGKKLLMVTAALVFSGDMALSPVWAQQAISEKEKYGGELRIAIDSTLISLDARYAGVSAGSHQGFQQIYDHLATWTEKGASKMLPGLATEWKKTNDLTWIVKLRKGVKYHNGKELTAQDVAQNFDWKINSKKYLSEKGYKPPIGRSSTEMLKSVEAVDRYTLQFNLKYPFGPFDSIILGWGLQYGPLDPEVVEKYGRAAALHPVGTGPFKFGEYVSGSHIILERFADYWGRRPYVDRVIFRIIPDAETRLLALQKGEVDIAWLPIKSLVTAAKDPNLKLYKVSSSIKVQGFFYFNHRRWPMNQLKFRQAVAMGVDWMKIVEAAFPKGSFLPWRTLFKDSFAENPEAQKLFPSYNPQKAKELLREVEKEAGKPIPARFLALTTRRLDIPAAVLEMAAVQLKKNIGLNLDVTVLEHTVYQDRMNRDPKSEWDFGMASLKGPGRDPYEVSKEFYSKLGKSPDGKNRMGYENPRVDELDIKGVGTYDQKERTKIYRELEDIVIKDVAVLPLFNIPVIFGVRKNIHDFKPHNSGMLHIDSPWNNIWKDNKRSN